MMEVDRFKVTIRVAGRRLTVAVEAPLSEFHPDDRFRLLMQWTAQATAAAIVRRFKLEDR